ncbi:MAG: PDZ domain-containing protein [Acidobacteriaceae bacterium]|nr:PDZ domain-containing protein [Acidobacteriaceae bacterium]MBV9764914.1 PDZ domain-containing protein [Acidobacteriaceae bacterium]
MAPDDVYGHLKVYAEVLDRIKLEYVEEPDMKSVTLGAINGLLESVDPFASYLNPDQYRQYEKSEDSAKAGVGLILAKRYGYVAVVDALPDSPAEKASITTGDLIESINGIATRDMPLAYAEQLLRGDSNTTVEITVLRLRNPDPQKITLTRTNVQFPPITAKLMANDVGYLHVTSLGGNRMDQTKAKLQDLKRQGAKYVVLDLRHCSTGEQQEGIPLANLFIDKGEIAQLKGQKTEKTEYDAKPEDDLWKGPLVIITDRATAGAAEIAAAALLDDKRAQVVGERSYGDASLRKTIQMDDGGAVILSVAKYYSPSGKAIQDTGVVPSVQLAETDNAPELDQDGNPIPGSAQKNTEDNLLKQSIDLVTGKTTMAQLMNQVDGPLITDQQHPIIEKNPQPER